MTEIHVTDALDELREQWLDGWINSNRSEHGEYVGIDTKYLIVIYANDWGVFRAWEFQTESSATNFCDYLEKECGITE